MAITETRPETVPDTHLNPWDSGEEYPDLARAIGSGDHKTLGRLWIGLSLAFGLVAWVLQALGSSTGVEDLALVPDDAVFQVLTLGHLSLVFLAVVPLLVGLATYLVPLQVGSSTVAFPRAAALALWTWLVGAVVLLAGYAANGGVAGGDAAAVDISLLGLAVVVLALMLATVCLLTTVIALRTPGMTLDRVPMFAWSVFVAGSMWMLSLPVLLANLTLVYVDHHYGGPSEFGLADNQWSQISWVVGQPQVFAYLIPVLGILGDVFTTTSGNRQRLRGLMLVGVGAFGVLTFGGFVQPLFNPDVWTQPLFVVMSVLIMLPTALCVAGWVATVGSRPRLSAAGITGMLTVLLLLSATLASALFAVGPLRLQETTAFQDAVLVLVVGTAFVGALSGLFLWAPKIWGHVTNEGPAKLAGLTAFCGVALAALGRALVGFSNRFDGLAEASDLFHVLSAAGAALVALSVLLTVVHLVGSARGEPAGNDPWGTGQTLEWTTSSPPPPANFGVLPEVTSAEPALDMAGEEAR